MRSQPVVLHEWDPPRCQRYLQFQKPHPRRGPAEDRYLARTVPQTQLYGSWRGENIPLRSPTLLWRYRTARELVFLCGQVLPIQRIWWLHRHGEVSLAKGLCPKSSKPGPPSMRARRADGNVLRLPSGHTYYPDTSSCGQWFKAVVRDGRVSAPTSRLSGADGTFQILVRG